MRVIQLELSSEQVATAKQVLRDQDVDYIHTDATNEAGNTVLEFPIPRQAVEHVLDELRAANVSVDNGYRVNLHADVAKTPNLNDLVARFVKGNEESDYIAREELIARAQGMDPNSFTYYVMTLVGVIVATSGLLMNSPAVVVGSMVVAPQLGAALTSSVGIVVNDREMITTGLSSQVLGLSLGLIGSILFGVLLRSTMLVTPVLNIEAISQIGGRVSPGALSVVVAIAAGTAAVFSLASHETPSGALVGVMVSAALIPAAATAGLGIAWGLPRVALGAGALLTINVVIINLTGPVVLWFIGYRPEGWTERPIRWGRDVKQTIGTMSNYTPSVIAVLLLVGAATTGGLGFSQQITYEQSVKSSIDDVIDTPQYEKLSLKEVTINRNYYSLGGDGRNQVQLDIGMNGESYPRLEQQLQKQIMQDTGVPVSVSVEQSTVNASSSGEDLDPHSTQNSAERGEELSPIVVEARGNRIPRLGDRSV